VIVVALRFPVAHGYGGVGEMASLTIADAGFGVEEVIVLVDVQGLVAVSAVGVGAEPVVDAGGLVGSRGGIAGRRTRSRRRGNDRWPSRIRCSHPSWRRSHNIVIAAGEILLTHLLIGDVGEITEVIAVETLQRYAADDVPGVVFVIGVPYQSVGVSDTIPSCG
jgi:hypothetical protein